MPDLYPILFRPILKDYVWGGRNLERLYGRALPPGVTAESWEIAAHPNGTSIIANGIYSGKTLTSLYEILGLDLIGVSSSWAHQRGKFPLLLKLLDAREPLSVQVHPGDEYAINNEGGELGKSEMWVVLHAEPGGSVILGVKDGTQAADFRRAALSGHLENYLHEIVVRQGDFICVPSGSLHAINGGLVIAEVQQNSDITYRVYDWDRSGPDRPLHMDKAIDVINFEQVEPQLTSPLPLPAPEGQLREELCSNPYFRVERWFLPEGQIHSGNCDGLTYEIWGSISGKTTVKAGRNSVQLPSLAFCLLPAALGNYDIKALSEVTLLRVTAN